MPATATKRAIVRRKPVRKSEDRRNPVGMARRRAFRAACIADGTTMAEWSRLTAKVSRQAVEAALLGTHRSERLECLIARHYPAVVEAYPFDP